jgi:hypothetical protein
MTSTMLFSGTTIKCVHTSKRTETLTPISNKYKIQEAGSYQSLRHDGQEVPVLLHLLYWKKKEKKESSSSEFSAEGSFFFHRLFSHT